VTISHRGGYIAPQGIVLLRAVAMPPGAVALGLWPAALAAMQTAHPLATHRRLPARPMVAPAARLTARRKGKLSAPPVARWQHWTGHRVGVAAYGFCPRPPPERGEVEVAERQPRRIGEELQGGEHEPDIIIMVLIATPASSFLSASGEGRPSDRTVMPATRRC
jgi:hypothetical protein